MAALSVLSLLGRGRAWIGERGPNSQTWISEISVSLFGDFPTQNRVTSSDYDVWWFWSAVSGSKGHGAVGKSI